MFKAAFCLSHVLGSLGGAVKRSGEVVYAYVNNTDMTITQSEVVCMASFCGNSMM